jgi:hypothetical protein
MPLLKHFILSAIFLTLIFSANAQKKMSRKDSVCEEKIRQGKMVFSQLVAPASAPETGFLLGSASAFTFTTNKRDTSVMRSTIPVIAYVSVRGSYGAQIASVMYFSNHWRWLNYAEFNHMVDNYWGVGYEAGSALEQGKETTQYTKNNFKFNPRLLKEIKPQFFAGIQGDYNFSKVLEANEHMQDEPAYVQYGDNVTTGGAGAIIQYDTRDMIVNTWQGMLFELSWLSYPSSWSTGRGYSILNFDYRHFETLGKPGKVLAWNIRSRLGFGDVPYPVLSDVGSGNDLRGYYGGRYRDNYSLSAMVEYRHTFRKKNGLSKHGVVVWTGAGQIFNDHQPMQWNQTLPVIGAGYRFALQPRINLRIDAGFGKDSSAFYINVTEAF